MSLMKKKPEVDEICTKLVPPLVDFQIPAPRVLFDPKPSPVLTYMRLLLLGSKTIAVTAMLSQKSLTACQVDPVLVISLLYHKPPETPPAHTLLVEVGSQVRALVLPPTLSGPLSTHGALAAPGRVGEGFCCICFVICKIGNNFSTSGLLKEGFIVAK